MARHRLFSYFWGERNNLNRMLLVDHLIAGVVSFRYFEVFQAFFSNVVPEPSGYHFFFWLYFGADRVVGWVPG